MSSSLSQGSSPHAAQNWLKTAVQTFFATCNWDNRSTEALEARLTVLMQESVPLTLDLTVSQFIAAVNWDGIVLMSQVPAIPEASSAAGIDEELDLLGLGSSPQETFTLTDFSDLF